MADLEESGLLYAPHTSAGRLPTEAGMRMFVSGLLEVGALPATERESIDGQCRAVGKSVEQVLEQAISTLSGLSRCAGMVLAPKAQRPLKHIEFVPLSTGRALVVLVGGDGLVENRVLDLPRDVPPSAMVEAGNFLNTRLAGRTLEEAREHVLAELDAQRGQLDVLTKKVVEAGLAT